MFKRRIRKWLWAGVTLLALITLSTLAGAWRTSTSTNDNGLYRLAEPLFLKNAHAEEAGVAAFIDSEAGIAAYFQATGALDLATAKPLFRTIEVQTDDYIIGSIAVPDYASESEDVHVYMHKDGWVLAYFLAATPAANVIDWPRFTGTTIVTKFDTVFQLIAAQLSFTLPASTYYDFRNPNANSRLLAAEKATPDDSFTVFLNEGLTYYERSWSLSCNYPSSGYLYLNGTEIKKGDCSENNQPWLDYEGLFTTLQLPVNTTHTLRVNNNYGYGLAYGALGLVYRRN
jgi:hypothetical protein